jgi:hypothetical protein
MRKSIMKETQIQFLLDIVHIPAIVSTISNKHRKMHHVINSLSLRNVSALKGPSSGTIF